MFLETVGNRSRVPSGERNGVEIYSLYIIVLFYYRLLRNDTVRPNLDSLQSNRPN